MCVNLPLGPWLPLSWAQPLAHTESGEPWRSTAVDAKGKERYLIVVEGL